MVTSQDRASMHDTRSHTALNETEWSEYNINAWDKITYFLNEFKWLQVRVEHECMTPDHIQPKWIKMVTSQNTASMNDKRSHTNWMISNGYKSEYSINPTSIHGKIRGDSQNSPCEQQRTQLTAMFWSKVSGKNTTANVLYSTKAVFQRATYATAALRCRIYGCGDDISPPVAVSGWALWTFHLRMATVR